MYVRTEVGLFSVGTLGVGVRTRLTAHPQQKEGNPTDLWNMATRSRMSPEREWINRDKSLRKNL
jgi:hypothetical protein